MKFLRIFIKIICVILAVCLAWTAVFYRNNGVDVFSFNSENIIRAESISELHYAKNYQQIASSGFISLYYDSATSAVAVKEATQEKVWHSMPEGANASIANMSVIAEDGIHYLNTQDNSVGFSTFKSSAHENGIKVIYTLADTKAVAEKSTYGSGDVAFEIVIDYTLKDGSLFVDASYKNLNDSCECTVSNFTVLGSFGAFNNPAEDDFLLLPDGCGALAIPFEESQASTYSCKVYGNDYAIENEKSAYSIMGAFGFKNGNSACAVIIDKGEEYATITAKSSKTGFSSVSADFKPNAVSIEDNSVYAYNNSDSLFSLCYKFLSGSNATYSEIASSCREQYIRNGTLPSASIKSEESLPVFVTLTGTYKTNPWNPVKMEYTDFSQAQNIISRMKAKGIDNIKVRYKGVIKSDSDSAYISSLGGMDALKELTEYTKAQNISLYFDANIEGYQSFLAKTDLFAAKTLQKQNFSIVENSLADGMEQNSVKFRFRKIDAIKKRASNLIERGKDYEITGFCLSDVGKILYTDISSDKQTRSFSKQSMKALIPAFSNMGKVMVERGNIYSVKGANAVVNIPMDVFYTKGSQYRKIPFVQSVLHGMAVLSGTPINTAENGNAAMLQSIEYGVCPAFSTVYSNAGNGEAPTFEKSVDGIYDTYSLTVKALTGLESERITEHIQLKENVFCTTFDNGVKIFVNYNKKAVTVNGVSVEGESFLRIG